MKLISPLFEDNADIPPLYSRQGDDISPPLRWQEVPEKTESFALIVEDPDAPGRVFTHWLIYNLPESMRGLDREVPTGDHYGAHAYQGLNDYGGHGYGGPQPPQGTGTHRYIFTLYALDTILPLESGADKTTLRKAMEGHILAEAKLTGRYEWHNPRLLEQELKKARAEEDAYDKAAHYGRPEGPEMPAPDVSVGHEIFDEDQMGGHQDDTGATGYR